MIDTRKNKCYVIRIKYMHGGKEHSQKFVSQHGMNSTPFITFRNNYFKNVLGVSLKKIGGYDGDIGSQTTISNESWPQQRVAVLDGITDAEKCQ